MRTLFPSPPPRLTEFSEERLAITLGPKGGDLGQGFCLLLHSLWELLWAHGFFIDWLCFSQPWWLSFPMPCLSPLWSGRVLLRCSSTLSPHLGFVMLGTFQGTNLKRLPSSQSDMIPCSRQLRCHFLGHGLAPVLSGHLDLSPVPMQLISSANMTSYLKIIPWVQENTCRFVQILRHTLPSASWELWDFPEGLEDLPPETEESRENH